MMKIRNPNIERGPADRNKPGKAKSEIRSSKEAPRTETNRSQINLKLGKFKTPIPVRPVWNIELVLSFIVLKLFRISDFEFRIYSVLGVLELHGERYCFSNFGRAIR
jgi:hypothetical protein